MNRNTEWIFKKMLIELLTLKLNGLFFSRQVLLHWKLWGNTFHGEFQRNLSCALKRLRRLYFKLQLFINF